jgi:hypothetical protein
MNDRDGVVKGLGGRGKGDDLEIAEIIMRSTIQVLDGSASRQ